ncbi:glycosyltransferase [Pseudomonas sp. ICMP 561]|uniref:glycosyltransferase n=1 Tax=Pseudomonas sp. ICMP 561 TaxID=1718918 RepID=UPI0011458E78|nr:glycosyltransferase [Pseudomonas sp. ICMP 561]
MSNIQGDKPLVIGWCVTSLSLDVASIRYRAILPAVALEASGHKCEVFHRSNPPPLESLDILIVVKDFSVECYGLMQRASRLNIPVIFDLCDNIFVPGYGKYSANVPSDMFKAIAKLASGFVVTTIPLAEAIENYTGGVPVHIIPDGVISLETNALLDRCLQVALDAAKERTPPPSHPLIIKFKKLAKLCGAVSISGVLKKIARRWRSLLRLGFYIRQTRRATAYLVAKARMTLQRLTAKRDSKLLKQLDKTPNIIAQPSPTAKQLLWFGNHGADYANFGIRDVVLIKSALEFISKDYDVELVIVSNDLAKYETYILPMNIPSRYVPWSKLSIELEMQRAHVVLLPNSLDAFSICKSANRAVQALVNGLPVIATNTPALAPLRGAIVVDDFIGGLKRYLSSASEVATDVKYGQELAAVHFSPDRIAQLWFGTLTQTTGGVLAETQIPKVIFVLHLIQDLDILLPIIIMAKERTLPFEVWCSATLLNKSSLTLRTLHRINVFPVTIVENQAAIFPVIHKGTKAMLSATETNLAPHAFTRAITDRANKAGLKTATLQHGFENVGLTYSDEVHSVQKVNFSSSRIYIWGPLETLHPDVNLSTRQKCVPMGCPKLVSQAKVELDHLIAPDKTVVGIFENLHWHRYSDEYRSFFLEGVQNLATSFPDFIFLIKPHNAGLWLTRRYKGDRPAAPNIVIVDPENREWQNYTADQLMGRMAAVITSPSTVALDAARRGLPVALVAHDMALTSYAPLPQICKTQDWADFVLGLQSTSYPAPESLDFVTRAIIAGPTASKILDDLIA